MFETKNVRIFLSGRVQGVGFRAFIRKNARKFNVNGWAKNLNDGRVEAVFSGNKEDVDKLLELVKKGPRFAEVDNFEIKYIDNKEFDSFEIRY